jgi:hypothetical protein
VAAGAIVAVGGVEAVVGSVEVAGASLGEMAVFGSSVGMALGAGVTGVQALAKKSMSATKVMRLVFIRLRSFLILDFQPLPIVFIFMPIQKTE